MLSKFTSSLSIYISGIRWPKQLHAPSQFWMSSKTYNIYTLRNFFSSTWDYYHQGLQFNTIQLLTVQSSILYVIVEWSTISPIRIRTKLWSMPNTYRHCVCMMDAIEVKGANLTASFLIRIPVVQNKSFVFSFLEKYIHKT